jgi:hypothetical protein
MNALRWLIGVLLLVAVVGFIFFVTTAHAGTGMCARRHIS